MEGPLNAYDVRFDCYQFDMKEEWQLHYAYEIMKKFGSNV